MPSFSHDTIKCLRVDADPDGELHAVADLERPVAEFIADGFTEMSIHCASCRFVASPTLAYLCRGRDSAAVTFGELRAKLRCSRCGKPPYSVRLQMPTPTMPFGYGYPVITPKPNQS